MYWRVKKISQEQIVKTYGIPIVCVISVLLNLISLTRMAPSKALTKDQQVNLDGFAREVTRHLTDGSFLTYEKSMSSLQFANEKSELGPDVIKVLRQQEIIQPTFDATKAVARQLKETKSVSTITIDEVHQDTPNGQGFVPIEVSGRVVKHSAEGVLGPDAFRFRYLVGMRGSADNQSPVVVRLDDLSSQPSASSLMQQ